ncbi:MAG: hypothetical protein HYV40_02155 [Candidatus Levybacteria bacterium]|nr:hypothetical protein [Candidatus Levybacteria bacterium]
MEETFGEKVVVFIQNFFGNFSGIKNNRLASFIILLLVLMFMLLVVIIIVSL